MQHSLFSCSCSRRRSYRPCPFSVDPRFNMWNQGPLTVYLVNISWTRTKSLFAWVFLLISISRHFIHPSKSISNATSSMKSLQIAILKVFWISIFLISTSFFLITESVKHSSDSVTTCTRIQISVSAYVAVSALRTTLNLSFLTYKMELMRDVMRFKWVVSEQLGTGFEV